MTQGSPAAPLPDALSDVTAESTRILQPATTQAQRETVVRRRWRDWRGWQGWRDSQAWRRWLRPLGSGQGEIAALDGEKK